jgi:hypothetical protein
VYSNPTRPSPRAAAFIARLPVEAYSPGLGRAVRLSEQQRGLLVILSKQHTHRLRQLATDAGYADAAGTSRALRQLERLGMIARSSTRGRNGSTVAWVRAGARMAQSLAVLMRAALARGAPGNVSAYKPKNKPTQELRTPEGVVRVDTIRPASGPRAARALLDPLLFPMQSTARAP